MTIEQFLLSLMMPVSALLFAGVALYLTRPKREEVRSQSRKK